MTISEVQKDFWEALLPLYGDREAKSITKMVLEKELELSSTKLSFERFRLVTQQQQQNLPTYPQQQQQPQPGCIAGGFEHGQELFHDGLNV